MLEHERSKATNSITKNATKFKREVSVAEFENGEGESASENEMLRPWSMYLSLMILEKPHVNTVTTTTKWLSSNLKGETKGANEECFRNMNRQWTI